MVSNLYITYIYILYDFNLKGAYDETEILPGSKSRTAQKPKPPAARPEEKQERPTTRRRPSDDDAGAHRKYAGMDREIVEEFISVALDPKLYSREQ